MYVNTVVKYWLVNVIYFVTVRSLLGWNVGWVLSSVFWLISVCNSKWIYYVRMGLLSCKANTHSFPLSYRSTGKVFGIAANRSY